MSAAPSTAPRTCAGSGRACWPARTRGFICWAVSSSRRRRRRHARPLFTRAENRSLWHGNATLSRPVGRGAPALACGSIPAGGKRGGSGSLRLGPALDCNAGPAAAGRSRPARLRQGAECVAWRHRFCANCGKESGITEGGWRRDCPACGAQHFPRTDPVVIMLPIRGDRCLMAGRRISRRACGLPLQASWSRARRRKRRCGGRFWRKRRAHGRGGLSHLPALALPHVADDGLPRGSRER